MNLHRRWAGRRAWRVRALLVALLAIGSWLLRGWLGYWALPLPLLGLLYPGRREETRALLEIDRSLGLAYRTALETPPADPAYGRLHREAERVANTAVLPRFPWPALLLAAGVWLAAGLLPPPHWSTAATAQTAGAARGPSRPAREQEDKSGTGKNGGDSGQAASGQMVDQETGREAGRSAEGAPSEAGGSDEAGESAAAEKAATSATETGAAETERALQAGKDNQEVADENMRSPAGAGENGAGQEEGAKTGEAGERAVGEGKEKTNAPSASAPDQNGDPSGESGGPGPADGSATSAKTPETMPVPSAAASSRLPSPWKSGSPPEDVRRAAERYIENNPLPPGAAEALKRYFELGD